MSVDITGEILDVPIEKVHPDPTNPNKLPEKLKKKLHESLSRWGQFIPVVVRDHPYIPGEYMLVDGEQRWTDMKDSGNDLIRIIHVSSFTERDAAQLLVVINGLRGEPDLSKLSDHIRSLEIIEEFELVSPWSDSELESIKAYSSDEITTMEGLYDSPYTPVTEAEKENKDKAAAVLRLTFSDVQHLKDLVRILTKILVAAKILPDSTNVEGYQIPVVDLGSYVYKILRDVNVEKAADRLSYFEG